MISVVIPVYNTPPDMLERCLESVREQTFQDYEVILVNDGSTSLRNSEIENMCRDIARHYVIQQHNQGVSAARNTGIKKAAGEYVTFVDADDTLPSGFFQSAYQTGKKYHADLVIGMIQYIPGKAPEYGEGNTQYLIGDALSELKKALLDLPQNTVFYPALGSPCGRLYKTALAREVLFPEGVALCEDQIFNRAYIERIRSAVLIPSVWYFYHQNDFSAMHDRFDENYVIRIKPFWKQWGKMNESEKDPEIRNAMYRKSISLYYGAVRRGIVPSRVPWREKRREMLELLQEDIFLPVLQELSLKDGKSLKEKAGIWCLKKRWLFAVYWIQKLKYHIKVLKTDSTLRAARTFFPR